VAQQVIALLLCAAVLAVGFSRGVNIGILMLAAASLVGVFLAGMSPAQVYNAFPVNIVILLVGITFFFGIAQSNGTIDLLIHAALRRVGDRAAVLPLVFFALTALIAAMGNPFAAIVMFPIAMSTAQHRAIDPMLMGLALGTGVSAGAFAPTSLFGVVSYGTAQSAGIALDPAVLLAVVVAVNLVLLSAAYLLFGRPLRTPDPITTLVPTPAAGVGTDTQPRGGAGLLGDGRVGTATPELPPAASCFTWMQRLTAAAIAALATIVIGGTVMGMEPDVGTLGLILGALLCVVDPALSKAGVAQVDWPTVLLVSGIITYVGVLQHLGATDMLGELAANMDAPVLAVLFVCCVAGLVSAFASTTAMLAALVPLAIPLVASGEIPGWALICAIGICASIVDVSPFSSVGAVLVASAPEPDRPRMTRLLTRWGLSLVVIGPVAVTTALVLPAMVL
jgi:di/tricarboxylate transporter